MNRIRFRVGWGAALAALLLASPAAAVIDNSTQIDVNSISCYVTNHDSYAYNIGAGVSGLEFPRGSGKTAVFAAGIWVGAKLDNDDSPTVKVGEYSWQWGPGTLDASGAAAPDDSTNYVYKIRRGDTPSSNWQYAHWPSAKGAPTNADGTPQILGDMTLWSVYNDRASTVSSNNAGTGGNDDAHTLGLEIQQTTFGFSRTGALNNCIFLKYKIINKGAHQLHQTYMSLWADPDLGDANDDLVGCDTSLSVGYVYNSSNNDGIYGVGPPSVGWDFFQGPVVDKATGRRLGMTSFVHYTNGRDPQTPSGSYNNMQGLNQDGTPIIDPTTGNVTNFDASGDPVAGTGFLDPDPPADRRLMLSTGPFDMAPGDTQEIVCGVIVGRGGSNKSSITVMKLLDKDAQDAFDANFDLASPPTPPTVTARALGNQIDLSWDAAAATDTSAHQHKEHVDKLTGQLIKKDYYFEGFNVYQLRYPGDPSPLKIATFDVDDSVQYIYGDQFNVAANGVQREVLQQGSNAGVRYHFSTTQDAISSTRLVNNRPYYFAVTAYNYEANYAAPYVDEKLQKKQGIITESLENDPSSQVIAVTPSSATYVYSITADHVSGTGDGAVTVDFFHPDSANDHTYEVSVLRKYFTDDSGDPDSTWVWRLTDLTTNTIVRDSVSDFSGLLDESRTQGNFEVEANIPSVASPSPINTVTYTPAQNAAWFTGDGFGSFLNGSTDLASNFFGTTLGPNDLTPVELRFDPSGGQMGYAYRRDPTGACGGTSYGFEGIGTVPLTAWDVSNPASPRQLNLAFVQNCGDTTDTNPPRWLPSTAAVGGREYLFILKSSYQVSPPVPAYTADIVNNGDIDMMYFFAVQRTDNSLDPQKGDLLKIATYRLLGPDDRWRFTFTRPGETAGSVVNNDMSKIRVVPNPYLNHSQYEVNQFNRIVKFTHLPAKKVTIKIYNLAGDLVRTIHRDDVRQAETTWDLQNESALPVASGVYIYRVIAADGTAVTGRLAVFLEREKLNFF